MYDEMQFLELFGTDAFISVNKHLVKRVGLVEAVFFGELLSKYKYYKSQGQLVKEKWFYATVESIEESLNISKDIQEPAIKNLVKMGLIEKKIMGLPAKRHFAVNVQKLMDIYLKKASESPSLSERGNSSNKETENPPTRKRKSLQLDEGNSSTIKKSNKNKEIKTNNDLKIVNKESIIDFCNSLYTKYSIGRWSKQQWNTLIDNFVNETNWKDVNYPKAYIIDVLETIAYKHDFKYGKVEKEMNENSRIFLDLLEQ